jgi:glutathione S-transferase|tara:strand:- start:315 stop:890 length:576 start_codon:yes stop_codon:yes gene_type:complete
LALANSEIKVEIREVFLKERPQSLYDISPKGTVPVLHLSEEAVIDESIDIMKWALAQSSSDWYNSNLVLQDKMIHYNDIEFKQWLDKYKYHDQHPENTLKIYRDKCLETLLHYEKLLKKNSYLLANNIQLVDVAIFPFVRQCANVDRDWFASTLPHVEQWLENWIQSELFVRVMLKFEAWKLEKDPLYVLF